MYVLINILSSCCFMSCLMFCTCVLSLYDLIHICCFIVSCLYFSALLMCLLSAAVLTSMIIISIFIPAPNMNILFLFCMSLLCATAVASLLHACVNYEVRPAACIHVPFPPSSLASPDNNRANGTCTLHLGNLAGAFFQSELQWEHLLKESAIYRYGT